jgi:hypothetical protein
MTFTLHSKEPERVCIASITTMITAVARERVRLGVLSRPSRPFLTLGLCQLPGCVNSCLYRGRLRQTEPNVRGQSLQCMMAPRLAMRNFFWNHQ